MTDRGSDPDPFRAWLEASRGFFAAQPLPEPLRERCESLFAAWGRFADTYAEAAGDAAHGPSEAQERGGPFDPLGWMDAASGGGFGDLWRWFGAGDGGWKAEREALLGSREWAAYALALGRYQAVMAEAWLAAFRRFSEALAPEHGGEAPKEPPREPPPWETIRARWQEAADLELAKAMRSEAFLDAQRELIRARLDCAALIRARLERLADLLGMPTRAETDELGERLHRLEREVRALKARPEGGG